MEPAQSQGRRPSGALPRVRSPQLGFGLLATATTLAVAMQMLSPFTVASPHRSMAMVPFLGYYDNTSLQTVSNVAEIMMAFFPIGFAAAMVTGRSRRAWMLAIGTVLAISAPIEQLQGWIVAANGLHRYPDITDIAIAILGGAFGAWAGAAGWSRFRAQLQTIAVRSMRSPLLDVPGAPLIGSLAVTRPARCEESFRQGCSPRPLFGGDVEGPVGPLHHVANADVELACSSGSRRSACDGWLNETRMRLLPLSAPTNMLSFQLVNLVPV